MQPDKESLCREPLLDQVLAGMDHFEKAVIATSNNCGTAKHRLLVSVKHGRITQVKTDDETEHLPATDVSSSVSQQRNTTVPARQ